MYYLGIDLGGTYIKAAVVTRGGEIIRKGSVKTGAHREFPEIVAEMGALCLKLIGECGLNTDDIISAGVGSPGTINSQNGIVTYCSNLDWHDAPLTAGLGKHIGKKVFVSNDANAAALGEALFGAGKSYKHSIFITLGTGVGSGVIIDGKLFEGNKSAGTELGHVKLGDQKRPCACGRLDCWETYSSATALINDSKAAMQKDKNSIMWDIAKNIDAVDGKTVFRAADRGDAAAQAVLDNYIYYLGEALINFANIFRSEAIIIGGGISAEACLIPPLQAMMDKYIYGGQKIASVKVVRASLGNDAGVLGAASLAITYGGKA